MKTSKNPKKINVRLTQEQYDHLPFRYRNTYIRRLIDQDMVPDKEESFLQYMENMKRSL